MWFERSRMTVERPIGVSHDENEERSHANGVDDRPLMCFNRPETWQLGWFTNCHVDHLSASGFRWDGNQGRRRMGLSFLCLHPKLIIQLTGSVGIYAV